MDAKELRIGNWVYQGEYGDSTITAYNIHQFSLIPTGVIVSDYYKEWKPISLTEEWLVKFGFKDQELVVGGNEDEVMQVDTGQEVVWIGDKRDFEYCIGIRCQYVHQLQNLYFALTGEELTIKE